MRFAQRCTKSRKCPKLRKKKFWENFRHQTEKRTFPHKIVPLQSLPPCTALKQLLVPHEHLSHAPQTSSFRCRSLYRHACTKVNPRSCTWCVVNLNCSVPMDK